jgi:hypothetical protein
MTRGHAVSRQVCAVRAGWAELAERRPVDEGAWPLSAPELGHHKCLHDPENKDRQHHPRQRESPGVRLIACVVGFSLLERAAGLGSRPRMPPCKRILHDCVSTQGFPQSSPGCAARPWPPPTTHLGSLTPAQGKPAPLASTPTAARALAERMVVSGAIITSVGMPWTRNLLRGCGMNSFQG